MTPPEAQPCSRGLTPECFRADPAWAKSAFAARLICLLVPCQISRKLQQILRPALIAPGVTLPPGVEPPPGVLVTPGTDFPPGWTDGDPLPPGAIENPAFIVGDLPGGAAPPTYVAPGQPGPVNQPGKQPPPPAPAWEVKFNNTFWQRNPGFSEPNWDGSKWTITTTADTNLLAIGTWSTGYRPTIIRLTLTPAASSLEFMRLHGTFPKIIAYEIPYPSGTQKDLTFGGGAGDPLWDIYELHLGENNTGINITNIEFHL